MATTDDYLSQTPFKPFRQPERIHGDKAGGKINRNDSWPLGPAGLGNERNVSLNKSIEIGSRLYSFILLNFFFCILPASLQKYLIKSTAGKRSVLSGIRYSESECKEKACVGFPEGQGERKGSLPLPQVECRRNRFCHLRADGEFISFQVKKDFAEGRGGDGDGTDGPHKTHTSAKKRFF